MAIAPNPVIEAYLQGLQMKNEQDYRAQELKQRQNEQKQQQQQFDAQLSATKDWHDVENNRLESSQKFTQAIQELQQQQEIQAHYAKYGLAPGGSTVQEPTFSQPREEDVNDPTASIQSTFGLTVPKPVVAPIPTDLSGIPEGQGLIKTADGKTIPVMKPLAAATQAANINDIINGPTIRRQEAIQEHLENIKIGGQKEIEKMKMELSGIHDDKERASKLAEIQLREDLHNAGLLAAAKARGTTDKAKDQSMRILDKFRASPIAKTHSILSTANEEAQSIPNDTKNPANDIDLVYAFAKAQDPNYAIRADKFNVVKENTSTLTQRFGVAASRISNSATFLTKDQRANIKAAIANKVSQQGKEFDLLKKGVANEYKNIGQKPEDWITEEEFPSSTNSGSKPNPADFDPNK